MKVINLEKLLPADIPEGEEIVWFGRPDPINLWRRAYHADIVAAYFAVLAVWGFFAATPAALPWDALAKSLITLSWGATALSLLGLLAYLSARTTLYVVTTRRLVLKVGMALPIFHNVPFVQIESASLRAFADGAGDIAVKLADGQRIAYLTLWPSARPFHLRQPEPSLRGVANAREVARLLTRAIVDANGGKANAAIAEPHKSPALTTPATA